MAGSKPVGYLQAWPRIWTRDYREQVQQVVRAGLELWASKLQVQRFNRSATLPPRLYKEAHQTFDIGIWISIGRFKQQQQQQLYFKLFVPKIHTQPASSKGYSRRVVLK